MGDKAGSNNSFGRLSFSCGNTIRSEKNLKTEENTHKTICINKEFAYEYAGELKKLLQAMSLYAVKKFSLFSAMVQISLNAY